MHFIRKILLFSATLLFFSTISSFAEIPSGIPEKASHATQYALHWSIDRALVRIEIRVESDPGKVWRNNTTYRFAFYSRSKQEVIWSDEEGNMDASGSPVPSDWSTETIPSDFDDLPQALEKTNTEVSNFTSATLYYEKGKPQWFLVLPSGDALHLHPPGESVESEMNDWTFEICEAQYEKKNFNQAFECFKDLAEKGMDVAQFNLAVMYIHGEGVEKSFDEAKKWLNKAADQGNPGAKDLLMKIQLLDFIKAAKVADDFRKEGQSYFYQAEESYKKGDYANAFKLYKEASDHSIIDADYKLGLLYYNGQGTSKDVAKGMELIRSAAKFGSPEAKKFLETHK